MKRTGKYDGSKRQQAELAIAASHSSDDLAKAVVSLLRICARHISPSQMSVEINRNIHREILISITEET